MSVLDYDIATTMPDADFLYFFKELGATKDYRISKANFLKEVILRLTQNESDVNDLDNGTVKTTGAQTVAGLKTFIDDISIGDSLTSVSSNYRSGSGTAALAIITSSGNITWVYGKANSENYVISRYIAGVFQEGTIEIDNSTGATMIGKALQLDNGAGPGSFFSLMSAGNPQWNLNNNSGQLREFFGGTVARTMSGATGAAGFNFDVHVAGTLSKAAGTFDIPHVLPKLENATGLRHSFVESPIISNIYYGSARLKKGKVSINIDSEYGMTEGTLLALNTDLKPFTKNENNFIQTKSKLVGNTLNIIAEDLTCEDEIYWEVKGRRHDKYIMQADITDEDGKLIVEYEMKQTLEEKEAEKVAAMKEYEEYEAHEKAKKEAKESEVGV